MKIIIGILTIKMVKLHIVPAIQESWTIEEVAQKATPPGWEEVFEYAMHEIKSASEVVEIERKKYRICPMQRDLFRAFNLVPFDQVKVVILGQDPYPQVLSNGIPRATGLSFSVRKSDFIPSSLQNIYKELQDDIPDFKTPDHGCLEGWARQGVLFLNTALTLREGESGSHVNVWQGFTRKVIRKIVEENEDVIFVLWGGFAQKMTNVIGGAVTTLTSAHPSGRSANRGFFGCKHFSQINENLNEKGYKTINWNDL